MVDVEQLVDLRSLQQEAVARNIMPYASPHADGPGQYSRTFKYAWLCRLLRRTEIRLDLTVAFSVHPQHHMRKD